jgi:hypothetical protein
MAEPSGVVTVISVGDVGILSPTPLPSPATVAGEQSTTTASATGDPVTTTAAAVTPTNTNLTVTPNNTTDGADARNDNAPGPDYNAGLAGTNPGINSQSYKQLPATEIIPNPLHEFATYTYGWSLWWLDINDYNTLVSAGDFGDSIGRPLGPNSYVVAEDSGLYPTRRAPTQIGLNYQITRVNIQSTASLDALTKTSNQAKIDMTIIEPYGISFVDSLIQLSWNPVSKQYENWTQQPFMLQLDFFGYDDSGNPIPREKSRYLRKRFPVTIASIKLEARGTGTEYKLEMNPNGHRAWTGYARTPKSLNPVGGTVKQMLDDYARLWNEHYKIEQAQAKGQWADQIEFKIHPDIANTEIVYDKQMAIGDGDPNSPILDLTARQFKIPPETQVLAVIDRILAQSKYVSDQLNSDPQSKTAQLNKDFQVSVFKYVKTTAKVEYQGVKQDSNAPETGAFDNIRNTRPIKITYNIAPYAIANACHPDLPLFTDTRAATVKKYTYLYTGTNTDIIDFRFVMNCSWYQNVSNYTRSQASAQSTASTGVNTALSGFPTLLLSPQLLAASGIAPFGQVPTMTPLRLASQVNDARDTTGGGVGTNPAANKNSNVIRSIYNPPDGDMLVLEMTILGDPTLLKQDDWLFIPDPTRVSEYFGEISQSDFAKKYGTIRTDLGQQTVTVEFFTPLDLDTDWQGTGLVFPQPGTYRSLFSGQYTLNRIISTFENGKFTQKIHLSKIKNADFVAISQPDAVFTGSKSQTGTAARQ